MENEKLRGNNDIILLSLLATGDSYGYALSQRIAERSGGAYTMKGTTLYSAISRLERLGLVCSYRGSTSEGRVRTYLSLTERGREYFAQQCTQWNETVRIMRCFLNDGDQGARPVY